VPRVARSGAGLASVVSFHGLLDTSTPEDARTSRGRCWSSRRDDPYVPTKQVEAFQEEMRKGGVDWQFVTYGGAVHRFTNPEAWSDNSRGRRYNERRTPPRRSWEAIRPSSRKPSTDGVVPRGIFRYNDPRGAPPPRHTLLLVPKGGR